MNLYILNGGLQDGTDTVVLNYWKKEQKTLGVNIISLAEGNTNDVNMRKLQNIRKCKNYTEVTRGGIGAWIEV